VQWTVKLVWESVLCVDDDDDDDDDDGDDDEKNRPTGLSPCTTLVHQPRLRLNLLRSDITNSHMDGCKRDVFANVKMQTNM